MRLLGFSQRLLVADMVRLLLPGIYISLEIAVLSGFFIFASNVTAMTNSYLFRWKLLLIIANLANAILWQKLYFLFSKTAMKVPYPT
ncbi:MAG: hypothetical protein HC908_18440 [Calothrix sp. SM1_7_51]|nr:hypothetical protein [Calothrix sp. SM1_7_51]